MVCIVIELIWVDDSDLIFLSFCGLDDNVIRRIDNHVVRRMDIRIVALGRRRVISSRLPRCRTIEVKRMTMKRGRKGRNFRGYLRKGACRRGARWLGVEIIRRLSQSNVYLLKGNFFDANKENEYIETKVGAMHKHMDVESYLDIQICRWNGCVQSKTEAMLNSVYSC